MAAKKTKASVSEQPSLFDKISDTASSLKTEIMAGASAVTGTVAEKFSEVKEAIKKKITAKVKSAKKAGSKVNKKSK